MILHTSNIMDPFGTTITFMFSWWIIFLISLSFGIKIPQTIGTGHASSAPENPKFMPKIIISTILATIFTVIFQYYMETYFYV